jgi:hypothetical protein
MRAPHDLIPDARIPENIAYYVLLVRKLKAGYEHTNIGYGYLVDNRKEAQELWDQFTDEQRAEAERQLIVALPYTTRGFWATLFGGAA